MKHVFGNINADGKMRNGEGIRDSRRIHENDSVGLYEVLFEESFSQLPTVVASQNYKDWGDFDYEDGITTDNVVIVAVNENKVIFKTGNGEGVGVDRNFTFIAIGV